MLIQFTCKISVYIIVFGRIMFVISNYWQVMCIIGQKWDFEARHVPSRVFIGSVYARFSIRAGVDVHRPRGYGRLTVLYVSTSKLQYCYHTCTPHV